MEFAVTTIVALTGVFIGYITWKSQISTSFKRMHYTGNSMPLPSRVIPSRVTDLMKLDVAGQELIFPMLHVVAIENTGRSPIKPEDFGGPLRLTFSERSWICQGSVSWNRPDVIPSTSSLHVEGSEISFSPVLLNPGDRVTIVAVVDGIPAKPDLIARIAGVKEPLYLPVINPDRNTFALHVSSLVHEVMPEAWPDAVVMVGPILMTSKQNGMSQLAATVEGRRAVDPHFANVQIEQRRGSKSIHLRPSLTLHWPRSSIAWVQARIGEQVISSTASRNYLNWSAHHLHLTRLPEATEPLSLDLLLIGDGEDLQVENKPALIRDVQIAKIDFGDLIQKNLAQTRPRLLLTNLRVYTLWAKSYPVLVTAAAKVFARLRRVLNSATRTFRGTRQGGATQASHRTGSGS